MIPSTFSTGRFGRQDNRFAPVSVTLNGILQALADSLLHPAIVLAPIAFLFGGSAYQIASFATVALVAWALGPLVVALIGRATSRSNLFVLAMSLVRVVTVLVIGFAALRIDRISTSRFLTLLVGAFIAYQAASALIGQVSGSMVAASLRGSNARRVFLIRRWLAVAAMVLAAAIGWSVFDAGVPFQRSVRQILLLAVLAAIAAMWFLLQQRGQRVAIPALATGSSQVDIWRSFRVPALRRFLGYKALLLAAAAVDPFLLVFGFQQVGLQVSYLGLALLAMAAGHALGHLLWPRWMHARGPRVPFQVAALLRLALLLWLVAVPGITSSSLYTDRFDDTTVAMRGFAIGFVLLGLASSAGSAGNQRYLMDITRPESLPGATLATNLVSAAFGFGPLVVARLMGDYSLERILWGAAVCAGLALLLSGLLVESSVRVRTPVGTWRAPRQAPNRA